MSINMFFFFSNLKFEAGWRSLKKDLPQLGINTSRLDTAFPFATFNNMDGLWEIRCEALDHFISKGEHIDGLEEQWWISNYWSQINEQFFYLFILNYKSLLS